MISTGRLRLSAHAPPTDAHAADSGSPMEESDIRGELLMATASKDTLLQSMRDALPARKQS